MTESISVSPETLAALKKASQEQRKSIQVIVDDLTRAHLGLGRKQRSPSLATYAPKTQLRQRAVVPLETAVLFIDVQNYNCHPEGAEAKHLGHVRHHALCNACSLYKMPCCLALQLWEHIAQGSEMQYWWRRVEETKPKWTQLRDICRAAGVEVMYTVIQSLTADGRDQSLDYKISGFHVPPGSFDAEVGPFLWLA